MNTRLFFLVISSIATLGTLHAQRTEFSGESAQALLRTLVLEIGPRPMGSPAEQRALHFAARKFTEFGCDTSYIMHIAVADGINTNSGVAVGVKKGKSGRTIVIGGHIDTSGPRVPGANDDGSGVACVLELARVIAKREPESTVLFCCWGGEEQGLLGSEYFVENYALIDSVVLMLQIDMADGASHLIADPDGDERSAPRWLLNAAFEESYGTLQQTGLVYQTTSATLNAAVGGAYGSDHVSFINKGIPAIDFTSDVSFPIHTPLDRWENLNPSGLQRSGDLVLRLFERFDAGVPSRDTEEYQVFQLGSKILTISYPLLWLFILFATLAGIFTFGVAARRRQTEDPSQRVKWSGFKILIAALFVQIVVWSSETILGLFTEYRFGWVGNFSLYVVLGVLAGILGVWCVARASKRFRLSGDAFVFERIALLLQVMMTLGAAAISPELGIYPAATLLLFAGAMHIKRPALKLLLFVLAVLPLIALIFFDGMELFQRGVAQSTPASPIQQLIPEIIPVFLSWIFSLPFAYGFAAIYRESGTDLLRLKKFRSTAGLAFSAGAVVLWGGFLSTQAPYTSLWHSAVRIEQRIGYGEDTVKIDIRGSEQLKNLRGRIGARDTLLDVPEYRLTFSQHDSSASRWLAVADSVTETPTASDSTRNVELIMRIEAPFRPLRVEAVLRSEHPFEIASGWAHGYRSRMDWRSNPEREKRFVWYAFPDARLIIPVILTLKRDQAVERELTVTYDSLFYPVSLNRERTMVSSRTIITLRDSVVNASSSLPALGSR